MNTDTKLGDFNKKSLTIPVDDALRAAIMLIQARGVKMTPAEIVLELMKAAAANQAPRFVVLTAPDQAGASLEAVNTAMKTLCKALVGVRSLKPGTEKETAISTIFVQATELWALTQRLAKIRLIDASQITTLQEIKKHFVCESEELEKKLVAEPNNAKLKTKIAGLTATINLLEKLGM